MATAATSGLRFRPARVVVRRDGPLGGYESALGRAGFRYVAGADEAGRGACAGPLVVAACILPPGRAGQIDGLDDSKVLTPAVRERLYARIVRRALAYTVVVIPAAEIDAYGLHVANLAGMRRAVGTLAPRADYALTDGFAVPGLAVPSIAVWKGDATVACIAAASILAKVTRDAIMTGLHDRWPDYEFFAHKGYITPAHEAALTARGPCPEHRRRYVNVRRAMGQVVAASDNEVVGLLDAPAEPLGETA
ncbi:ribonuclease HII [uncultured Jatrophihabitans sp.]|uniref:ribonuclease HII n=1 Tax=uncultured Jatrophihabitans sp. TaxID=1610747 RepID=UPI0035C9B017